MKKTIDSASQHTMTSSMREMEMLWGRDLWKDLGRERKIPVRNEDQDLADLRAYEQVSNFNEKGFPFK